MSEFLSKINKLDSRLGTKVGPRGGKIIGETRSGKPIYAAHGKDKQKTLREQGAKHTEKNDDAHKDYTLEDHIDAMAFHKHNQPSYRVDMKANQAHAAAINYHDRKIGEMTDGYKFTQEHREMAAKSNDHYRPKSDKVLHQGLL